MFLAYCNVVAGLLFTGPSQKNTNKMPILKSPTLHFTVLLSTCFDYINKSDSQIIKLRFIPLHSILLPFLVILVTETKYCLNIHQRFIFKLCLVTFSCKLCEQMTVFVCQIWVSLAGMNNVSGLFTLMLAHAESGRQRTRKKVT